jgi:RimJ/RimL family protein N-acetyltransferase
VSERQRPAVDLRAWAAGDLALEERLLGDPAMTEYIGGPESKEKIRERHERFLRMNDGDTGRMFVIVVGPERVAAGSVGYWETEWQGQPVWETGWFVLPEWQGQGIASAGTALLVARARDARKHRFLHAFPPVENGPSNGVCRKVGFTLRGAFDFEYPPGHPLVCNDWVIDLFGDA